MKTGIRHDILDPVEQYNWIKRDIVGPLRREAKAEGKRLGLLDDDSILYLKNRGRTTKRKEATLAGSVSFINVPFQLEYVGAARWDVALKAAEMFYQEWVRLAPFKEGGYLRGMTGSVVGLGWRVGLDPEQIERDASPTSRVQFVNDVDYASTLESNAKSGLMFAALRKMRSAFGNKVSSRFIYVNGNRYQHPSVEIAPAGTFTSSDSKGRRKNAKARDRAARRR